MHSERVELIKSAEVWRKYGAVKVARIDRVERTTTLRVFFFIQNFYRNVGVAPRRRVPPPLRLSPPYSPMGFARDIAIEALSIPAPDTARLAVVRGLIAICKARGTRYIRDFA